LDDLNILIKAKIDAATTNINKQIKDLQKQVTTDISVKLKVDAKDLTIINDTVEKIKKATSQSGSQKIKIFSEQDLKDQGIKYKQGVVRTIEDVEKYLKGAFNGKKFDLGAIITDSSGNIKSFEANIKSTNNQLEKVKFNLAEISKLNAKGIANTVSGYVAGDSQLSRISIKPEKIFDRTKLEAEGRQFFVSASNIIERVKKEFKSMGEVDVNFLKNSQSNITGFTASVTKADGVVRQFSFDVAKIQSGNSVQNGYVFNSEKLIDKNAGANLDALKNKMQSFTNQLERMKTSFTSPATGIADPQHLNNLVSQYNQVKNTINQVLQSSTNLSNEQRRGIVQNLADLRLQITEYKDLQRIMKTSTGGSSTSSGTLSDKDISLYQATMQNKLASLQVGKMDTVFARPEIQAEVNRLTESLARFGMIGGKSAKELNLQFAQLTTSVRSATNEISRINNAADSLVTTFTKDIFKLGLWAGAATAFYAPFRAISQGIQYVYQMDTALTDLSKVVDFSSNQLNEMANASINLGKQLGQSSVEIMKGMAEFGRVTKDQNEIIELTKVAGMASNVTTMSAADAARNITSSMITFGIEAKDSMKILNSWNQIQNNFRVSAEDLASSISKIGAASRLANTDMEDLEGMTTAIVNSLGISGNEAGTAIKSFMSRIYRTDESDPEELGKTAKALKSIMDIDTSKANGELKSFNSLISEIKSGWSEMSKQEQLAVAQSMGSTYHYSKFVALMESYQIKLDAASMARNSENSALEENAKKLDSISGRLGLLKVASEEFWASTINSNTIKGMISSVTYLVSTFANLATILALVATGLAIFKGTQITASIIAWASSSVTLTASLTASTRAFITNRAANAGYTTQMIASATATRGMSLAMHGLKVAILSNPIGLIIGAITAVVIAIDIFNQKQEENARKAEETSQKIKQEQDALNGLSEEYTKIIQSGDLTAESKSRLKGIQDELIKTYGAESKNLDLINGKYKDQIGIIDKLAVKKAKEQLASMGNSGEEALAKSKEESVTQVSFGSSRKAKEVNSVISSVMGDSVGLTNENKQLYEINGTLEKRVEILGKLSLALGGISDKDKFTKELIKEVSDEFNKLNGELKDNQTILDKFLPSKNIIEFDEAFGDVKKQVAGLKDELSKNPNDKGIIKQLQDLHNATSEKNNIEEFRSQIDKLFEGVPDKAESAINGIIDVKKAVEDVSESTEDYLSDSKDLASTIAKMNDSHKMTTEELYKLIKAHPELASAMTKVNGLYTIEKSAIEKVMEAKNKAHKESLDQKKEELEQSKKLLLAKLSLYGQEVGGITSVEKAKELVNSQSLADPENRAEYASRQSILKDLQAIEDALKGVEVSKQITPKDLIASANPDLNKTSKEILENVTGPYADLIRESAKQNKLSATLIDAVIKAESNFDSSAHNASGASGLMQLMPGTSKELGVSNVFDPAQNVEGGSKYLSQMMAAFNNDKELALAAYNWGIGNVKNALRKSGGATFADISGYAPSETRNYVSKIMSDFNARKSNETAVAEIGDRKLSEPSYTDNTDALIAEANAQSLLTAERNKSLQSEIDQAKSAKDYSLVLSKTTELIQSQSLEIQQLNDARDKINALKDASIATSPFGDTSRWYNDANEASTQYVSEFNSQTAEVQKQMESTFITMQKLRKGWQDNKKSVDDLTTSQKSLKQSLLDIQSSQADEAITALKSYYQNEKELAEEAYSDKVKLAEKAHQKVLDDLDDELNAYEETINAQIDAIDKLKSAEDYTKNLTTAQSEAQTIQDQINIYSRDTSYEGKEKLAELQAQLAEKNSSIEDMQNSHTIELRKQNLQDSLDAIKKELEAQKSAENTKYEATKERLDAEKVKLDAHYKAIMEDEAIFAEIRQGIIDGNITKINVALTKFSDGFTIDLVAKAKKIDENFSNIIDTINQIKKASDSIPNYDIPELASGTSFHKGGPAKTSEEGRELIIPPNSRPFLSGNNGPEIMNLEKGTEVVPHNLTEQLISKAKLLNIPSYANGTGINGNGSLTDLIKNMPSILPNISLQPFKMPQFINNNSSGTNVTIPNINFNITSVDGVISRKELERAADFTIKKIEKSQIIRGR